MGRTVFNIIILGLLGWALVWFFVADRFYVSQIVIDGNKHVPAVAIADASGLGGYNTFYIHPRRVADQIVESIPPITSVRVHYDLSNVATLSVEEQSEQLLWQVAGKRYWVDQEGILCPVLCEEELPTMKRTLLVHDVRAEPPEYVDGQALVAARQMIPLLPEVREVEYAPSVGLRFVHARGWMVLLGSGSDIARKVDVLRKMEVKFAGQETVQPELMDLRFPESPYFRFPETD